MRMMRMMTRLCAIAVALAFVGCGNGDGTDPLKAGMDAAKKNATSALDTIKTKLASISDEATAKEAKKDIEPLLDKLLKAKETLKEKMPSLDELKKAGDDLMTKFADNEAVKTIIEPIVTKIKAIAG